MCEMYEPEQKYLRQIVQTGLVPDGYNPYEIEDAREAATARVGMFIAACALSRTEDNPIRNEIGERLGPMGIIGLAKIALFESTLVNA